MTARISAIIPSTGRPELVRAVRSATAQTIPCEVIVVAAKPGIERSIEQQLVDWGLYARILPADRPLNGSEARNRGVKVAQTEFVGFLDDDDWWDSDKSRLQLQALDESGNPMAVSTTATILTANEKGSERRVPTTPFSNGKVADYLLSRWKPRYGGTFMQSSSLVGRRSTFLEIPWDVGLAKHQDWDLFIRLIDQSDAPHVFCADALTHVALGSPNSVSGALRWRESLDWVEGIDASARAHNDFILTIPLTLALRAGDSAAVRKCFASLKPALPHSGAALAIVKELMSVPFLSASLRRNRERSE